MENIDRLRPAEAHRTKREMENVISLKLVTSRGKRYVYLRGTGECLVRGFIGPETELGELIETRLGSPLPAKKRSRISLIDGWRTDAARKMHKTTGGRARYRERDYDLTPDVILGMLKKTKDRYEVTGLDFDYRPRANQDWRTNPFAPSLDRINNNSGYGSGNVRLVCACVNYAINEFGLEIFDKICRAFVAKHPIVAPATSPSPCAAAAAARS